MFQVSQFNMQQQIINKINTCLIKSSSTVTSSLAPSLLTGGRPVTLLSKAGVNQGREQLSSFRSNSIKTMEFSSSMNQSLSAAQNSLNPFVSKLLIKILEIAQ